MGNFTQSSPKAKTSSTGKLKGLEKKKIKKKTKTKQKLLFSVWTEVYLSFACTLQFENVPD